MQALDDGDARSQRTPRLGELHARDATAKDDEVLGYLLRGGGLAVGPGVRVSQPGDRRHRGVGAGVEYHRLAGLEEIVPDPHEAFALEPRMPPKERDVPLLQPFDLTGVVEVVDDLVATPECGGSVQLPGHGLRGAGDAAHLVEDLARAQERLGGHARVVGALAAQEVRLDDRYPLAALLRQPPGGDLTGRTGADDDDVELALGCLGHVAPPEWWLEPERMGWGGGERR